MKLKNLFYLLVFVSAFSIFFFPTLLYAQSTTPWSFYNNPLQANAMDIFYDGVGAPNPAIRIQTGGNVGINSDNPSSRLVVKSADNNPATNIVQVLASNETIGMAFGYDQIRMAGSNANSTLSLNAKGTGNLLLQTSSSGYVGVGTMTPRTKLDVSGVASVGVNLFAASSGSKLLSGALNIGDYNSDFGGGTGWNTNTAGLLLEAANNTEIAVHDAATRIASLLYYQGAATNSITIGRDTGFDGPVKTVVLNGNVGIGTTTPGTKRLYVNGTARVELQMGINGFDPGGCNGLPTAGLVHGLCLGGSGYSQTGWYQGSDIRYKKNISPLKNPLAKVLALEGVTYQYNKEATLGKNYPDTVQLGFIAQQVEPIVPEVVTTDGDGYKSMNYANLTPLLSEAIKEQQFQIEQLKFLDQQKSAEIQQLRSEIEYIKQELKALKSQ